MASTTQEEKILLRFPEAAARLSVGRSTIYALIAQGELPIVKIGRSRRIPAEALHVWLRRQSVDTEASHAH